MRLSCVLILCLLGTAAQAQTPTQGSNARPANGVRTPVDQNGPFGSQWANPSQNGGYIYQDPRITGGPAQPVSRCGPGRRLKNGQCQ